VFDGWFSFGGTEVINGPRTMAYIKEMLPGLSTRHACRGECSCDHLAAFLGDHPYSTPLIDDAPWVDIDRPESFGFLGVMSQGVTGLLDDTATANTIEGLGDGGWVVGRRRRTKEVRFTVALFATDRQSSYYGTQWLKAALEGACGSGPSGCAITSQLCFLTDCVDPAEFGGVARMQTHMLADWTLYQSSWSGSTISLRQQTSWASISVSGACDGVEWDLQLRGTEGDTVQVEHDDGRIEFLNLDGTLQTFKVTTDGTTLRLSVPDVSGYASWTEMPDDDEDDGWAEWDTYLTPTPRPVATWSHHTSIPLDIEIVKVVSNARFEASPEECASEFYRYLRGVTRVEGPRERRAPDYPSGGGVIRYFDFILVADRPHIYGESLLVAGGSTLDGLYATAVPYRVVRLSKNVGLCNAPEPVTILDPLGPVTPPPPGPPPATDELRDAYVASPSANPYALIIPPETIPEFVSVVPTVRLTAGVQPVRYALVRFFPMPFDTITASDIDPCSACGEFEVSYIPPGGTFEVDGAQEFASINTGGIVSSANHLLTGPDGYGAPSWPALSCGVGYMVIIDGRGQDITGVEIELAVRE
jgi:hypothetical protein